MAIKFVVHQNPTTRQWHWRLRSAANDRDWAVSGQGYTRKERAIAACEMLWKKLAGSAKCPHIQINNPAVPALVEALGGSLRKPPAGIEHPSLAIGAPPPCPECGSVLHRRSCSRIGGSKQEPE